MSASVRSSFSLAFARTSFTTARRSSGRTPASITSTGAERPSFGVAGGKTFGRSVAMTIGEEAAIVATAFPA